MLNNSRRFLVNFSTLRQPGYRLVYMNWTATGAIMMASAWRLERWRTWPSGRLDAYSMGIYEKAVL